METNSSSRVFDSFELWLLAAIPTAHLLLVGFGVPLKSIVFIAGLYETSEVPLTAPVGEFDWRRILPDEFEWGRILPRACLTALNAVFFNSK